MYNRCVTPTMLHPALSSFILSKRSYCTCCNREVLCSWYHTIPRWLLPGSLTRHVANHVRLPPCLHAPIKQNFCSWKNHRKKARMPSGKKERTREESRHGRGRNLITASMSPDGSSALFKLYSTNQYPTALSNVWVSPLSPGDGSWGGRMMRPLGNFHLRQHGGGTIASREEGRVCALTFGQQ